MPNQIKYPKHQPSFKEENVIPRQILIIVLSIVFFSLFLSFNNNSVIKQLRYIELSEPFPVQIEKIYIPSRLKNETKDINSDIVKAQIAYAFNPLNGQVYFSKNIDNKVPIASITKLITALTIYNQYDKNDKITVSKTIPSFQVVLGLKQGEIINVENALNAILVGSKNDVAYIFQDKQFLELMNKHSLSLNMNNSKFSNTNGYYDEGNYSTARDLALLSSAIINNEYLLNITTKKYTNVRVGEKNIPVYTTNQILNENKYAKGLKTGYTSGAGQCLIMYYKFSSTDQLITIILNSTDRFGDSRKLYNAILSSYR